MNLRCNIEVNLVKFWDTSKCGGGGGSSSVVGGLNIQCNYVLCFVLSGTVDCSYVCNII